MAEKIKGGKWSEMLCGRYGNKDELTTERGKYNNYTAEQYAWIGKYAAENSPTRAARFDLVRGVRAPCHSCTIVQVIMCNNLMI